jgi:hypothetical protein
MPKVMGSAANLGGLLKENYGDGVKASAETESNEG